MGGRATRRIALSRPFLAALVAALALLLTGAATAQAAAPAAVVDGPDTAVTGAPVGFDASGSSDPDGGELRFAWAIDGQPLTVESSWLALSFAHPGQHVVTVTVTDATGATSSAFRAVRVTGADRTDASVAPINPSVLQGTASVPPLVLRPSPVRLRRHALRLQMRCRGAVPCTGVLRAVALVGSGDRPLLLAQRRFTIGPGGPRVVHVALDRRARLRLARHPRIRVTAYHGRVRVASIWATYAYRVG